MKKNRMIVCACFALAACGGSVDVIDGEDGILTISLAADPRSSDIVEESQNVPVLGITFTTGPEPVAIPSVTLTGQAVIASSGCSFGEQCAFEASWTCVTALSLWDGATRVGDIKSLDPSTGKVTITYINLAVPSNTSKTLVLKASFSSSASNVEPYDQLALGVQNPWEVMALDSNDDSVLGSLEDKLRDQLGSSPSVVHTILPSD